MNYCKFIFSWAGEWREEDDIAAILRSSLPNCEFNAIVSINEMSCLCEIGDEGIVVGKKKLYVLTVSFLNNPKKCCLQY